MTFKLSDDLYNFFYEKHFEYGTEDVNEIIDEMMNEYEEMEKYIDTVSRAGYL